MKKIHIARIVIDNRQGIVEIYCYNVTPGEPGQVTQQVIKLVEETDLPNPNWGNDDVITAISNMCSIHPENIQFLLPVHMHGDLNTNS